MKVTVLLVGLFGLGFGTTLLRGASDSLQWNPKAAAAYLDRRAEWWTSWAAAAREQGTFCISCHTALPFALARPLLRKPLGEDGPSANERKLLESVTKRVGLWKVVGPFYGDEKQGAEKRIQSLGTESVLNALILASSDAPAGKLSAVTRVAFENMWAQQLDSGEKAGAWPWLDFGNEPWEARDSGYYGATLAAVAVGTAPGNYAAAPVIQKNVRLLRDYLVREGGSQSPINRVFLLWASAKLPGLLDARQREAIIQEAISRQRPDGGWSMSSMAWSWKNWSLYSLAQLWVRADGTPLEAKSDGLGTALIVFALAQAGASKEDASLKRGRAWLVQNQNQAEGRWVGYSLNKHHNPSSLTGYFMSDAATAYAVLALGST